MGNDAQQCRCSSHYATYRYNAYVAELASNGSSSAACGDADVAECVVLLACPSGRFPLAARGLAAVLARGPARRALVVTAIPAAAHC
jgi:hypothetical protein